MPGCSSLLCSNKRIHFLHQQYEPEREEPEPELERTTCFICDASQLSTASGQPLKTACAPTNASVNRKRLQDLSCFLPHSGFLDMS